MKNVVCACLLTVGLFAFSFVSTANAVVSNDFTGSFVEMGTLGSGQSGTIYADDVKNGVAISQIDALLPSHNSVTFSYNFSGNLRSGILADGGYYSYESGGNQYDGFAVALSQGSLSFSKGFVNGAPVSTALAYASANLDTGNNVASATIANGSDGFLNITNALFAFVRGSNKYNISYRVTATPLPAALPMFIMGLLAVFGIQKRRKAVA